MKIRAYTSYSERSNSRYYRDFEIVDKLPEIGDVVYGDKDGATVDYGERERVNNIFAVSLDCEQGNDDIYNYDFFGVDTQFEEYDEESKAYSVTDERYSTYYYAVKRKNEIE